MLTDKQRARLEKDLHAAEAAVVAALLDIQSCDDAKAAYEAILDKHVSRVHRISATLEDK